MSFMTLWPIFWIHWEEAEKKEFLEEMIAPSLHSMFVTPKDVDENGKASGLYDFRGIEYDLYSGKGINEKDCLIYRYEVIG